MRFLSHEKQTNMNGPKESEKKKSNRKTIKVPTDFNFYRAKQTDQNPLMYVAVMKI